MCIVCNGFISDKKVKYNKEKWNSHAKKHTIHPHPFVLFIVGKNQNVCSRDIVKRNWSIYTGKITNLSDTTNPSSAQVCGILLTKIVHRFNGHIEISVTFCFKQYDNKLKMTIISRKHRVSCVGSHRVRNDCINIPCSPWISSFSGNSWFLGRGYSVIEK